MKNIRLIKASAGSGKTWSLMDRLTEATLIHNIKPASFLVTTFTRKAAAELQGRIRERLLQENRPELANEVLDGMIGTVNSVCSSLLGEYSIPAGLSPALDVIPEEQVGTIFRTATADVLEKFSSEIEPLAMRLSLDPASNSDGQGKPGWGKTEDWQSAVKKIVDCARREGISHERLCECGERCAAELATVFDGSSNCSLESILRDFAELDSFSDTISKTGQAVLDAMKSFRRNQTWANALGITKEFGKTETKILPPALVEAHGRLAESIFHSRDLRDDLVSITKLLFKCAAEMLDHFRDYKKMYGLIDFIDQETEVLRLANSGGEFGLRLAERVKKFMVDEFQDTSPIQLALFLAIHQFVPEDVANETVWVGDTKQSIYGFRGADATLLEGVERWSDDGTISKPENLTYSWRSQENLVRLSNEIFTKVFANQSADSIQLSVPDKRAKEAKGGRISSWLLCRSNKKKRFTAKEKRFTALAKQVALLIHKEKRCPGEIAILCHSNRDCEGVVKALTELKIQGSASSGTLSETPECCLVLAAYQVAVNRDYNSLAAATFLALYGNDDGETNDWLAKIIAAKAQATDDSNKVDQKRLTQAIVSLTRLTELPPITNETPLELLDSVILTLGLDEYIARMTFPIARRSNIETLRKAANEYAESARLRRFAVTHTGFLSWLATASPKTGAGKGNDVVNVMTYHAAKGLEWPVVILTSLDEEPTAGMFTACNLPSLQIDPNDPLRDRAVHYWPWAFGNKNTKVDPLDTALKSNKRFQQFNDLAREEASRLFYVGLTRAKEHIIFAMNLSETKKNPPKVECGWLDAISPPSGPLFTWPMEDGMTSDWKINGSDETFALETRILSEDTPITFELPKPKVYVDQLPKNEPFERLPASLTPSEVNQIKGVATLIDDWNIDRPTEHFSGKHEDFGSAFHEFVALRPRREPLQTAERILAKWGMDSVFSPLIVDSTERFYHWAEKRYPSGVITCELPMTLRETNGQCYQGYIDLLIETPDGFVIVDHKTHWESSDAADYVAKQAAQLRIYSRAVSEATGRNVIATYIHLPLIGQIYQVE